MLGGPCWEALRGAAPPCPCRSSWLGPGPRAPLTWLAAASRGEPPTEDAVALWPWATDVTSCSFAPTSQAQVCQEDVWRAQSSVHPARREVTRAQKRRDCGSYVTLGWSLNLLGPPPL